MVRCVLTLAIVALAPLAAAQDITGSGKSTTVKRELSVITAIEIRTTGNLEVIVGTAGVLEITGDDNVVPVIKTEVSGEKLLISCDKSFTSKSDLKFVLNVAALKTLDIYSTATAKVTGIAGESFAMEIHGSGKAALSGKTDNLKAKIKGSGKVDALNLAARDADMTITGTGSAQLNAADTLKVTITGTGKVEYTGTPKVSKTITGIGEVTQIRPDKKD